MVTALCVRLNRPVEETSMAQWIKASPAMCEAQDRVRATTVEADFSEQSARAR